MVPHTTDWRGRNARARAALVAAAAAIFIAGPALAQDEDEISPRAQNFVASGNVCYREMNYPRAVGFYDQAIAASRRYALAHNNRGLALHKMGQLPQALAAIKAAIQIDPEVAGFHLNLGKVHAASSEYEKAVAAFTTALEKEAGMGEAYFNLAWVYDQTGKAEEAAEAIKDASGPGTKLLAAILAAKAGKPEKLLGPAPGASDDMPPLWRWLWIANRSLACGSLRKMDPEAALAMRAGILAASCEQVLSARTRFFESGKLDPSGMALRYWLMGMSAQTEGDSKQAKTWMQRAQPFMPVVSLGGGDTMQFLWIDDINVGPRPITGMALPGPHVVASKDDRGNVILAREVVLEGGSTYDHASGKVTAAAPAPPPPPAGPVKPAPPAPAEKVSSAQARNWLSMGKTLADSGAKKKAIEYLKKVISEYPGTEEADEAAARLRELE